MKLRYAQNEISATYLSKSVSRKLESQLQKAQKMGYWKPKLKESWSEESGTGKYR